MATAKTADLDDVQKEQDKLRKDVERLRQEAEAEERKLIEQQQADSVKTDNALLTNEKERLQARLEAAKAATREYASATTPVEQAEAATESYQSVVAPSTTTEKKE